MSTRGRQGDDPATMAVSTDCSLMMDVYCECRFPSVSSGVAVHSTLPPRADTPADPPAPLLPLVHPGFRICGIRMHRRHWWQDQKSGKKRGRQRDNGRISGHTAKTARVLSSSRLTASIVAAWSAGQLEVCCRRSTQWPDSIHLGLSPTFCQAGAPYLVLRCLSPDSPGAR